MKTTVYHKGVPTVFRFEHGKSVFEALSDDVRLTASLKNGLQATAAGNTPFFTLSGDPLELVLDLDQRPHVDVGALKRARLEAEGTAAALGPKKKKAKLAARQVVTAAVEVVLVPKAKKAKANAAAAPPPLPLPVAEEAAPAATPPKRVYPPKTPEQLARAKAKRDAAKAAKAAGAGGSATGSAATEEQ